MRPPRAALLVTAICCLTLSGSEPAPLAATTPSSLRVIALRAGEITIHAEVADTPEACERGLQGRTGLPAGWGMLFPLPAPARPVFWMKGVTFALDLVWLREGRVAGIVRHTRPDTGSGAPAEYAPDTLIDAVLELPAGTATCLRPGDIIDGAEEEKHAIP